MAFGSNQLKNPTPANVNNIAAGISAVCGVVVAWMQTVDFIPTNTIKIISGIGGLIIGLTQALRPFFGQEIQAENVPAEQVKAIDTSNK